jgi:hypothetical protein
MQLDVYALLAQGIYVGNATPQRRLEALANHLRPVRTRHELLRLGGVHDGGYLVPDDLSGIAACFSPGVGAVANFEQDLKSMFGIPSLLTDGSVEGPPAGFEPLSFHRRYLGVVDNEQTITLDSWVRTWPGFASQADLLLQIDIEGAEYITLLGVSDEVLARFRVIVLEIHHIESWAHPLFMHIAEALFERLLARFHVVHSHPNNCCGIVQIGTFLAPRVLELTLLRKDRGPALGPCHQFPNPLDSANMPSNADLVLPPAWRYDAGVPRFAAE